MNWAEGAFILIDKPIGWTSFDVVKKIRNTIEAKVGHAGTLDPLATGLLILATGKFTKKIDEVQGMNKVYDGIMEIGKTTPSYDLETSFDSINSTEHLEWEQISNSKNNFLGCISQIPPAHSAVKINGQRAYKKARKNEDFKLKSREVNILDFELTPKQDNDLYFKVTCSKGTYIRSLIHDFGQNLGVGAYLKSLRRLNIGDFSLADAYTIDGFLEKFRQV